MEIEYNDTRNHRGVDELLAVRSDLAGEGLNPPDVEDDSSEDVDYSEDDDLDDVDYSVEEDEDDDDDEASDTDSDV